VAIQVVGVAPGGVGLPDLDQTVANRVAVAVEHSPRDDDPLPQRLIRMLAGQVVIQLSNRVAPEGGPVVSERVLGRIKSGFFGALSRVAA
jgi:hypothetical protein